MSLARKVSGAKPRVRGGILIDHAAGALLYFSPLWNDGDIESARAFVRENVRWNRRRRRADIANRLLEILEYAEVLHSIGAGPMRMTMGSKGTPVNPDRPRGRERRRAWWFYMPAKPFDFCWRLAPCV